MQHLINALMGHFHISPHVFTDLWTLSTGDSARGGVVFTSGIFVDWSGRGHMRPVVCEFPWSKVKEIKTFLGHWSLTPRTICYRSAKKKTILVNIKTLFCFFQLVMQCFLFWKIKFPTTALYSFHFMHQWHKPIEKWAMNKIHWRVCLEDVRKQWGCWMVTD